MDEIYDYNKQRWAALGRAKAIFTRPWLDLDAASVRERVDPWNLLGDLSGKKLLCLAGGGGQQSAAFALLGASVTVFDISDEQLAQDQEAARHYGLEIATHQGDMRDLSIFQDHSFDLVWQPYSINFVPDCRVVFNQVSRIIRPGGLYHFMIANPFACGMGTRDWNGEGYLIRRQYIDGAEITYEDEAWVFRDSQAKQEQISSPREYRQTLERILNGLVEHNFIMLKMVDRAGHTQNLEAQPGAWDHFTSFLPPWFWFWTLYRPDVTVPEN